MAESKDIPAGQPPSEKPPAEIHHPDGRIEHPSVRRETIDVRQSRIVLVFVASLCFGGILLGAIWAFFLHSERQQTSLKASNYPLAPPPTRRLPPEPRLDPLNRTIGDTEGVVRNMEDANLRSLEVLGPSGAKGFVRIPIEDAMKLIVSRLPVRKQTPPGTVGKDNGLRYGGEPNSGRVFAEPIR